MEQYRYYVGTFADHRTIYTRQFIKICGGTVVVYNTHISTIE